jgi:hypothetical protein
MVATGRDTVVVGGPFPVRDSVRRDSGSIRGEGVCGDIRLANGRGGR